MESKLSDSGILGANVHAFKIASIYSGKECFSLTPNRSQITEKLFREYLNFEVKENHSYGIYCMVQDLGENNG